MNPTLALLVLLLAAPLVMAAPPAKGKPAGRLFLIKGAVERQKAGANLWAFADTARRLMDSDRLRTGPDALAGLELPGGCRLYLGPRALVRIEHRNSPGQLVALNTATLFQGSAYVMTPEESDAAMVHTLLTPAASLSARMGSGFAVTADRESGTTTVTVLSGAVAVKNLLFPKSFHLASGRRIYIDVGRKLPAPEAADSQALSELRWLAAFDPDFIDREAHKDRVKREQIRAILAEGIEDRILFCRFKNASDYTGLWDIERSIPKETADLLHKAAGLPVEFADIVPDDRVLDSLKGKASIVVTGAIHTFDLLRDTRLSAQKNEPQNYLACELSVTFTLLSPRDHRTLTSFSGSESFKEKESPGNTFQEVIERPFILSDRIFRESLLGRSLNTLLSRMNGELRTFLSL